MCMWNLLESSCRRLFKFQLKLQIGLQDTVILNNIKNLEVILLFDSFMWQSFAYYL